MDVEEVGPLVDKVQVGVEELVRESGALQHFRAQDYGVFVGGGASLSGGDWEVVFELVDGGEDASLVFLRLFFPV